MKRFLILFFMMISFFSLKSFSQTLWYQSYKFAQASVSYSGNYTWSNWESSQVKIKIDWDNAYVVIYSPTTQYYQIVQVGETESDGKGGQQTHCKFVDGDGDRGTMSLRIERDGSSQLYIRFNNVAWVYCLTRIS